MPLMLAPVLGAGLVNDLAATPAAVLNGVSISASGSTHTKGSWTQLLAAASVTHDMNGFWISIWNNGVSASERHMLVDIGIGAASSEVVIVSNVAVTGGTDYRAQPSSSAIYCPIYIPKGTRIAARCQSNTASAGANIALWGEYGSPSGKLYNGADMIGADTATSATVGITTPTTAGTESAWTNIGSTTSRLYEASLLIGSTGTTTVMTSAVIFGEWGWSSGAPTIGEVIIIANNTELMGGPMPSSPVRHLIPTGTQLQARIESSLTVGEVHNYGILCFY